MDRQTAHPPRDRAAIVAIGHARHTTGSAVTGHRQAAARGRLTGVRILPALAALVVLARGAGADDASIAARVNGTLITDAMVNEVVKGVITGEARPPDSAGIARLTAAALESLIDLELLYQAAQAQKLTVSEQEVDADIARSRQHFPSDAAFAAALEQSGLTRDQLRADTRKTLLVDKLLNTVVWKDVHVEPDAARRFYDQHRAELSSATPGAAAPSFEKIEPSIQTALLQQAREERQHAYVAELRRTATIQRRDNTRSPATPEHVEMP